MIKEFTKLIAFLLLISCLTACTSSKEELKIIDEKDIGNYLLKNQITANNYDKYFEWKEFDGPNERRAHYKYKILVLKEEYTMLEGDFECFFKYKYHEHTHNKKFDIIHDHDFENSDIYCFYKYKNNTASGTISVLIDNGEDYIEISNLSIIDASGYVFELDIPEEYWYDDNSDRYIIVKLSNSNELIRIYESGAYKCTDVNNRVVSQYGSYDSMIKTIAKEVLKANIEPTRY